MNDSTQTEMAGWAAETKRSLSDVAEMLLLRRELAEAEIRSDLATARRFAVIGGLGIVAALVGLPLLFVVAAGQVDGWLGYGFPGASLLTGMILLGGGLLTLWASWRRFRTDFLGLRESLAELREDVIWLRELAAGRDDRQE